LNGVIALILRYFTEFGSFRSALRIKVIEDAVVENSRSLSHLLMSFLSVFLFSLPQYLFASRDYSKLQNWLFSFYALWIISELLHSYRDII